MTLAHLLLLAALAAPSWPLGAQPAHPQPPQPQPQPQPPAGLAASLQRAETLIAQGSYVEALAAARSAAQVAPGDHRVRYYLAMALLGLQRFDEARQEAQQALERAPAADRPIVEKLLATIDQQGATLTAEADAEAALAAGLAVRAARLFAQAHEADPRKAEAAFRAAELQEKSLSRPLEALLVLRRIEATTTEVATRERARREIERLMPVARPQIDRLIIQAQDAITAGDRAGASSALDAAGSYEPARREVIIERLRLLALGDDGRALERALMGLAAHQIPLEAVMPVLPRATFWAGQPWLAQLFEDYRGKEFAAQIVAYLRLPRSLRDCPTCPELVTLPPGQFTMGQDTRLHTGPVPRPLRRISIPQAFALGRFEVSWREYEQCVVEGGCQPLRDFGALTRRSDRSPAHLATFDDANAYARWLSAKTGQRYRLPSEAEWEYAARAGTTTTYYWGSHPPSCDTGALNGTFASMQCSTMPNVRDSEPYRPNPWGLFRMVFWSEWVADCAADYSGLTALTDGRAFQAPYCQTRIVRGDSIVPTPWNRTSREVRVQGNSGRESFRLVREIGG
jgi:formylglycine-generating enzyme required for sulfatase activity